MVVHQVVSETTPYQIQKKFYILGKFLLRKSYRRCFSDVLDVGGYVRPSHYTQVCPVS